MGEKSSNSGGSAGVRAAPYFAVHSLLTVLYGEEEGLLVSLKPSELPSGCTQLLPVPADERQLLTLGAADHI